MDLTPCLMVHNLASVPPKSIKPGQMTNVNMSFYVVVSVYRFVKLAPVPCATPEWPQVETSRTHTDKHYCSQWNSCHYVHCVSHSEAVRIFSLVTNCIV